MGQTKDQFFKREFWSVENLNYSKPHFRLEKSARLLNALTERKECDLLDVGCGPATLMHLLHTNIHYYGIDIALHDTQPNLMQVDFIEHPIRFEDRRFDVILAQGVFEYVGSFQDQKFSEISRLLKPNGTFVVSYVNFDHVNCLRYPPYNNMQRFGEFKRSLERFFQLKRIIPTSHHWHHQEPDRRFWKAIQMHMNVQIPVVSSLLAVENFFVCSPGSSKDTGAENEEQGWHR